MNLNHRITFVVHATLLLALLTTLPSTGFGQSSGIDPASVCGTAMLTAPPLQPGGLYLPTGNGRNGTPTPAIINALMLFIEFPDDDNTQPQPWAKMTSPNAMMSDIIDLTPGQMSGNKYNITTYFRDMSFGQFVVVGHPIWKPTRYTLAQYQNPITALDAFNAGHPEDAGQDYSGNVRYWAFRHVMEDLDPTWDFSPYDMWTLPGAYTYSFGPDGALDLIVACWRNDGSYNVTVNGVTTRAKDPSFRLGTTQYEGIAELGSGPTFNVDNGARSIRAGGVVPSGVTVLSMTRYPWMGVVYHEVGHLLGLGHQYSGGVWTLMGSRGPNGSYCMNSYEREQMGWMTITNVATDGQTATISDFATNGSAYRLSIDNNRSYLIENHQRKTSNFITALPTNRPWNDPNDVLSYDVIDFAASDGAPGLYILQESYGSLSVACADGRWSWSVVPCPNSTVIAPWSTTQKLLVWQHNAINRTGGSCDRQFTGSHIANCTQPPDTFGFDFIWASKDLQRKQVINTGIGKQRGDTRDRWRTGEIFSPWSNPSTRALDANTMVGVEVTGENASLVNVKFYLTDPESGPPSKPQDLRMSSVGSIYGTFYHPKLTWEVNIEDDVNPNGIYEIYRYNGTSWVYVTSVAGNVSTHTDMTYSFTTQYSQTIKYRIRAKDEQNKYSAYSDEGWLIVTYQPPPNGSKRVAGAITGAGALSAEQYPNPARAHSTITYRISEEGQVTIDVYDMRGSNIAMLVDEHLPAGAHTVVFDGSDLERGIYTYVVRHNGESFTGKIVLE